MNNIELVDFKKLSQHAKTLQWSMYAYDDTSKNKEERVDTLLRAIHFKLGEYYMFNGEWTLIKIDE